MNSSQQPIASIVGKGRVIAALLMIYFIGVLVLTIFLSNHPLTINSKPTTSQVVTDKPDFVSIENTKQKKQAFFNFLRPFVEQNNSRITKEREKLLAIKGDWEEKKKLSSRQQKYIDQLAKRYSLDESDSTTDEKLKELTRRVDIIPESLVLAQAAIESGWGTSRFARKANNFFGQWCYKKGCGLVPNRRHEDADHEVAAFDSVGDSVASYFDNLNTYHPYQELRSLRAVLRMAGKPVTGSELASGLSQYSERREAYVEEVRAMIRVNKLEKKQTPATD